MAQGHGKRIRSKTGFIGVQPVTPGKLSSRPNLGWAKYVKRKWTAVIKFRKVTYNLGVYETPESAARAYDAKAREFHGADAHLNFPEGF